MSQIFSRICRLVMVAGVLALAGCVTHYHPRSSGDGVYYDDTYYAPARYSRAAVDPVYYPYWSLDYFYFSHYRHPYSVVYGYDPFYRPYPGWYYGYRPGPRFAVAFNFGYWYPWYGAGFYYHYYRPWYRHRHHYHHHYHHHARPAVARRAYRGGFDHRDRGRNLYRGQQDDVRDSFAARGNQRRALAGRAPLPGERTRHGTRQRPDIERDSARERAMTERRSRAGPRPAISNRPVDRAARDGRVPERRPAERATGREGTRRQGITLPDRGIRVQPRERASDPASPEQSRAQSRPQPRAQPAPQPRSAPPPARDQGRAPPARGTPPPARSAPPPRESSRASGGRAERSGSRRR